MTDLSLIIRLGVGPEVSDVYEAVEALCTCPSPSKRLELIADLERAYMHCEAEYDRTEKLIDAFKSLPDEPAVILGGTVVPK